MKSPKKLCFVDVYVENATPEKEKVSVMLTW